jgi:hypothetical protein
MSGHEYNPSTSSPEIRGLLELHNISFVEDDHPQHVLPKVKPDFENGLGESFVLVEPGKDQAGCT